MLIENSLLHQTISPSKNLPSLPCRPGLTLFFYVHVAQWSSFRALCGLFPYVLLCSCRHYRYLDLRNPNLNRELKQLKFLVRTFFTDQFLQSLTDITTVDIGPNVMGAPEANRKSDASPKRKQSNSSAGPTGRVGSPVPSYSPPSADRCKCTWYCLRAGCPSDELYHSGISVTIFT